MVILVTVAFVVGALSLPAVVIGWRRLASWREIRGRPTWPPTESTGQ